MKKKRTIRLIKIVLAISLLTGLFIVASCSSNHKEEAVQINHINKIAKKRASNPEKIKPDLPVKQAIPIKKLGKKQTGTEDVLEAKNFGGFFEISDADLESPPNMLEEDNPDPYDLNNLKKAHIPRCYTSWTYVFPVMIPQTVCF